MLYVTSFTKLVILYLILHPNALFTTQVTIYETQPRHLQVGFESVFMLLKLMCVIMTSYNSILKLKVLVITNQNLTHEEIKKILNTVKAYYISIRNLCLPVSCLVTT
jgi:hypothetical protein